LLTKKTVDTEDKLTWMVESSSIKIWTKLNKRMCQKVFVDKTDTEAEVKAAMLVEKGITETHKYVHIRLLKWAGGGATRERLEICK